MGGFPSFGYAGEISEPKTVFLKQRFLLSGNFSPSLPDFCSPTKSSRFSGAFVEGPKIKKIFKKNFLPGEITAFISVLADWLVLNPLEEGLTSVHPANGS